MYVFVREDIPIADQIVQVGHACIDAGRDFKHPENTRMVLLSVVDERRLLKVQSLLDQNHINYRIYYEPDDDMRYTALATRTIRGHERDLFSKYKLWSFHHEKETKDTADLPEDSQPRLPLA